MGSTIKLIEEIKELLKGTTPGPWEEGYCPTKLKDAKLIAAAPEILWRCVWELEHWLMWGRDVDDK